ncbi:autotransporter outer membrane beta-barrel domain-containing protein [Neorhizobium sp. P12A]|nr:autotransporter outer membrane beta-barrel domain-containing protein [Neorhizobium sp. P12A]
MGSARSSSTEITSSRPAYQVEVDPTSSSADRIAVIGQATLVNGATVNVVKTVNAPYVLGTRYTILTTTGGLHGTYDLTGDTDLSAFISLTDDYDANNAYLVTIQTRSIGSVGTTPNQTETGTGIDSLPQSDPVKSAVLNLPDGDTANAVLDQLSGEIHASVKTATIENSHFVRDAAGPESLCTPSLSVCKHWKRLRVSNATRAALSRYRSLDRRRSQVAGPDLIRRAGNHLLGRQHVRLDKVAYFVVRHAQGRRRLCHGQPFALFIG